MQCSNFSQVTKIVLLGFQNLHRLKSILFLLLLIIYCITLFGNLQIILLVSSSKNLQTPMYFFLTQLAFSDILLSSSIVPNMLCVVLYEGTTITFQSCLTQFYFFTASEALECLLLTVMSYDRYQAICNPLHYSSVINFLFCVKVIILLWAFIFIIILMISSSMSHLQFSGSNVIDHFFCDFAPLLDLSCSDTFVVEMESMLLAIPLVLCPFAIITVSYIYIVFTILKIPSVTGRQKTFSTCSSHLAVVSLYYGSLISIYLFPNQTNIKKVLSLFYTVITPLLNPVIYSLRNTDIKQGLAKIFFSLKAELLA
ncbi:PREDICTED: olfactory receptor 11L1-like [Nanorana parkeri]|uniref:olfactory receptor 11L1-like n=1 Tax=Nanorana parkeri TaxID=125878 RepID=UPI00085452D9|nr:PREDICTED: olfactory receptor 11L1-like [Nanorana parkeri]